MVPATKLKQQFGPGWLAVCKRRQKKCCWGPVTEAAAAGALAVVVGTGRQGPERGSHRLNATVAIDVAAAACGTTQSHPLYLVLRWASEGRGRSAAR